MLFILLYWDSASVYWGKLTMLEKDQVFTWCGHLHSPAPSWLSLAEGSKMAKSGHGWALVLLSSPPLCTVTSVLTLLMKGTANSEVPRLCSLPLSMMTGTPSSEALWGLSFSSSGRLMCCPDRGTFLLAGSVQAFSVLVFLWPGTIVLYFPTWLLFSMGA